MDDNTEKLHELGVFEAHRTKEVLELLETHRIPFELELDESAQNQSGRTTQLMFGVYPGGTTFAVYAREPDLARARDVVKPLLPK
ncbi:MAG: hypothetical protein Q7S40_10340 [Opitutaceae bacterium]|nr:hypothetical protein [Opitutaceae bacterium]